MFLTLAISLISVIAFAQNSHIKLMGIELNGTISEFQTKIQAKGAMVSPDSKSYPNGTRAYNGTFSGEKATIIVWYNERTKQVYRAKAIIKRYGKDMIEQVMSTMEGKLDLKYGTDCKESELVKDDYLHEFKQSGYTLENGTIGLFVTSGGFTDQVQFSLHIDYHDKENYAKNTAEEMDDL